MSALPRHPSLCDICELTSTETASCVLAESIAASDTVEVLDIGVHVSVLAAAAKRRSRQSSGLWAVECLARLPHGLLLSYERGRDDCGRLLRGFLVFALRCAAWRRGGRFAASAWYDEGGRREREGGARDCVPLHVRVEQWRYAAVVVCVSRSERCERSFDSLVCLVIRLRALLLMHACLPTCDDDLPLSG